MKTQTRELEEKAKAKELKRMRRHEVAKNHVKKSKLNKINEKDDHGI